MKKAAAILFVGIPFLLVLGIHLTAPFISNEQIRGMESAAEPYLKHNAFLRRPLVDTVICGDSRVGRISPEVFLKRNWAPFNWGLSGLSPVDTAMQVAQALLYGKIRRAIIGVSFESMAEKDALLSSRYSGFIPFTDPKISGLWGLRKAQNFGSSVRSPMARMKDSADSFWNITKSRFRARLIYVIYTYIAHRDLPQKFDPYGTFEYQEIRDQIKRGIFDFKKNRDPLDYFNRGDSEACFIKNGKLSVEAKQIYLKIFDELRSRGIATVVFETGKLPTYQNMIDNDPMLKELNEQWRDFFRKESYGGIRFLDAKEVLPCYFFNEFFDSAHFIGEKTEKALSERLAEELERMGGS